MVRKAGDDDDFYEYCVKHDILALDGRLSKSSALSFMDTQTLECTIVLDSSRLNDCKVRRTAEWHEVGHCEKGAFYTATSPFELREKHEYAANKWAIKKLLPKEDMEAAIQSGCAEVWQLSDYFEVTEELIRFAIWVYFDVRM